MKNFIAFMMVMTLMAVIAMGATFDTKQEAENYVASLNSFSRMSVEIVGIEGELGSETEEVSWEVKIYKESQKRVEQCTVDEKTMKETCKMVVITVIDVLHTETLSSTVNSEASDTVIKALIKSHAQDWQKTWVGQQSYKVRQSLIGNKQIMEI